MSDSEIRPALSAEEWAKRTVVRGEFMDECKVSGWEKIVAVHNGGDSVYPTPARHALAALCLYQQPFGFSQEDVDLLGRLADYDHGEAACLDGYDNFPEEADRREAHTRSLAARIAALLPPPSGVSERSEGQ